MLPYVQMFYRRAGNGKNLQSGSGLGGIYADKQLGNMLTKNSLSKFYMLLNRKRKV